MKIKITGNLDKLLKKNAIDLMNKNEKLKKEIIKEKEAEDKKKHRYNPKKKYNITFVEKGKG
jgi:uncharacterized protein YfeS